LRFCKSMVKFITSNAVFTAANQGYGRSDGEMETDSFERAPRVNGDGIGRYGLPITWFKALMDFSERLGKIRKQRGLTQQVLSEKAKVSLVQLCRYEAGTSQPTLEVIRRLAIALSITTDMLIFGKDERGPDDDLRLQFEAISKFAPAEKQMIMELLDGLILKQEARRWSVLHSKT